jgi:type IV pilus assembly protein PilB
MDSKNKIDKNLLQIIPHELARQYRVVPIGIESDRWEFLIDESTNSAAAKVELTVLLGVQISLKLEAASEITRLLSTYYLQKEERPKTQTLTIGAREDFVDMIVEDAYSLGSSDIHIERYDEKCRIRFRVDGKLVERYAIPADEYPVLVNKIKIKARLDIAEKRLPQDGRVYFETSDAKVDLRVSTLPTIYGEKIVLRILGTDAKHLGVDQLGFNASDLDKFRSCIRRTNGIILISGPTGSGKSTTLYATLNELNTETKNIITVEDPIEYTLNGINQVQVKNDIGLDFATALRTILRQDPNIIMIGEIRDAETATMAIRAALTGHLVFSTIHTNSAWGTISRLTDMGIPPYLLASTIVMTIAQRLIRKLCAHCKEEVDFDKMLLPKAFTPLSEIQTHFVARGCEKCYYTGYKGRVAIYEAIAINNAFAESIRKGDSNVNALIDQYHVKTLAQEAYTLFLQGTTSLEEIYSIIHLNE